MTQLQSLLEQLLHDVVRAFRLPTISTGTVSGCMHGIYAVQTIALLEGRLARLRYEVAADVHGSAEALGERGEPVLRSLKQSRFGAEIGKMISALRDTSQALSILRTVPGGLGCPSEHATELLEATDGLRGEVEQLVARLHFETALAASEDP